MALVLKDRVRETTTVLGTNDAVLLGAVTGFQSFSVVGNANTCYYCIADQGGANWEVGIGTYSSAGPTLTRDTILASSNSDNKVNFPSGTKDVFLTYPSEKAVYLDASGNLGLGVTPSAWASTYKVLQIGTSASLSSAGAYTLLGQNFYNDGALKYISTGAASYYQQVSGAHYWYTAPSGTAGSAISFTQAMTLDASGNLGVGVSSGLSKIDASGTNRIQLRTNDTFPEVRSINPSGSAFKELGLNGLDVRVLTSNTERMRIDSSGNLGLGVTPSAWAGGFKAIDINAGGAIASSSATNVRLFQNAYFDGTNYIYKSNSSAGRYDIGIGAHAWFIAPSGTAGNPITFTQAMTLDTAGNLTLNDGNSYVWGATTAYINGSSASNYIRFYTGNTERMRIDSSGNLCVGTSLVGASGVSIVTGQNLSFAEGSNSSLTNVFRQSNSGASILASGYKYTATADKFASSYASSWAKSAISVGSAAIKFYVDSATTVAVGTDITPTERMRIDSSGNLLVNTTTNVSGYIATFNGAVSMSNGGSLSWGGRYADGYPTIAGSTNLLAFYPNGATSGEEMRLTAEGYLRLQTNGIQFNGDTAAANALDGYEEGTWTPAYALVTPGTSAFTYNLQTGKYTKVGDVVVATCVIRTNSFTLGTGSGAVRITGLPYGGQSDTGYISAALSYSTGFVGDAPNGGLLPQGATYIDLYYKATSNGGSTPVDASDLGTGASQNYVILTITYKI